MGIGATPYPASTHSSADPSQNFANSHSTTGLSFGRGLCFDEGSVARDDSISSVYVTDDVTNESEGDLLQLTIVAI